MTLPIPQKTCRDGLQHCIDSTCGIGKEHDVSWLGLHNLQV